MTTIPLTDAKAKLNELVEEAVAMHEQITITRRGRPAVVLVSVDDWESLQETLFWQSVPGIHDDIAEARRERAQGRDFGEDEVRAAVGLSKGR